MLYNAEQDKISANETPTDSFTTLDASATIHLFEGPAGDVDLVLIGTNLTDSVGRNAVSFTKDHVLLPGRRSGRCCISRAERRRHPGGRLAAGMPGLTLVGACRVISAPIFGTQEISRFSESWYHVTVI